MIEDILSSIGSFDTMAEFGWVRFPRSKSHLTILSC
jgi:hypothetical protein